MRSTLAFACLAVTAALAASCHSSSSPAAPPASPTTYGGTFSGTPNTSGTLTMTVTPVAAAPGILPLGTTQDPVTGSLTVTGSSAVTITGTFVPPNGPLNVTGGNFTLTGYLGSGVLSGQWTGPSGAGWFGMLPTSDGAAVNVYCGSYVATSGGPDGGIWNLAQSGTDLTGSFTSTNGGSGLLFGSITDGTMNLSVSNGGSAVGSINGTSVAGTWTTDTESGTWSGSIAACSGTGALAR